MTSRQVLGSLGRTWWLLLIGLCLTVGACLAIRGGAGSYWAQTTVYFLAPTDAQNANKLVFTTDSVIATAGLVAYEVDPVNGPVTNTDTTLVAEGVRDGHRIRLPDSGGQWAANFDRPALDVQVVAPTAARVETETTRLIGAINRRLTKLQDADGVPPSGRITTTQTPVVIQVQHATGRPTRAVALCVLVGVTLTALTATAYDRRRSRSAPTAQRVPVGV
jgi:hypothetical protein